MMYVGLGVFLLDKCVSVWTIPSVLRYFYLLWEVCAFTSSVLLGNGVNNLDQLRVTYKKYRHQLSVTNGVRDFCWS